MTPALEPQYFPHLPWPSPDSPNEIILRILNGASINRQTIQNRELQTAIAVSSEYVVECIDSFKRAKDLYLVFEFAPGVNMQQKINATERGLPKDETRRFCYELTMAVHACHRAKIIHRDIKPENLLLDKKNRLKLCDFGVARVLDAPGAPLSNYVATRWYRPPELELRSNQYSFSADIWAIGCILVEMANGYPLFPGESSIDQLHLIEQTLGPIPPVPGAKVVRKVGGAGVTTGAKNQGLQQITSAGSSRSASKTQGQGHDVRPILKKNYGYFLDADGLDFLEKTIRLVPSERPTTEELLAHPYLAPLSGKGQREGGGIIQEMVEEMAEECEESMDFGDTVKSELNFNNNQTKGFTSPKPMAEFDDEDEYSDCFESPVGSPCHSPSPVLPKSISPLPGGTKVPQNGKGANAGKGRAAGGKGASKESKQKREQGKGKGSNPVGKESKETRATKEAKEKREARGKNKAPLDAGKAAAEDIIPGRGPYKDARPSAVKPTKAEAALMARGGGQGRGGKGGSRRVEKAPSTSPEPMTGGILKGVSPARSHASDHSASSQRSKLSTVSKAPSATSKGTASSRMSQGGEEQSVKASTGRRPKDETGRGKSRSGREERSRREAGKGERGEPSSRKEARVSTGRDPRKEGGKEGSEKKKSSTSATKDQTERRKRKEEPTLDRAIVSPSPDMMQDDAEAGKSFHGGAKMDFGACMKFGGSLTNAVSPRERRGSKKGKGSGETGKRETKAQRMATNAKDPSRRTRGK